MNRLFYFIILVAIPVVWSCEYENEHGSLAETSFRKNDTVLSRPAHVVFSFLNWYNANHLHLADSLVLNCTGNRKPGDSAYYAVNFPATEKYLETLISTGYVSRAYIAKWRRYFKDCQNYFTKSPENEGPPTGFDYDFILHTQMNPFYSYAKQAEDTLNQSNIVSEKSINDKAEIRVEFPSKDKYVVLLSKINEKWLIDDIFPM